MVMLLAFKYPTHFIRVGCTAICLKCAHIILQLATFVTSTNISTQQISLWYEGNGYNGKHVHKVDEANLHFFHIANTNTNMDATITIIIKASDIMCCGDMGTSSPLISCSGKSISMGCTLGLKVGPASALIGTVFIICHSSSCCEARIVPIMVFLYLQQITNIDTQHNIPIMAETNCIHCHHSASFM